MWQSPGLQRAFPRSARGQDCLQSGSLTVVSSSRLARRKPRREAGRRQAREHRRAQRREKRDLCPNPSTANRGAGPAGIQSTTTTTCSAPGPASGLGGSQRFPTLTVRGDSKELK